ncbi:MAG: mechanosensitive ion channel family protein [Mogibacterium sp.]|nr:mechanosensitive ion channel family protein [Mogibacterium sp.]
MENVQAQLNNMDVFMERLIDFCTSAGVKILLALLIYIVGKIVINKLLKLIDKIQAKSQMEPTARSYIRNIIKAVLYVILVVAIIGELGVPMASVITVIASAGVAVGMALQGSLSNLAGGIMLMVFRPFSVGDYIIAGGEEGVVKSISTFYTVLNTVDNKAVSIPNGALMNSNISNCSSEDLRRVDLTFNIAGSEPIKKVQATIMKVIVATEKAMADPAPDVQPLAGIPGGLTYTVRVWCNSADYWDVYFELMREIPTALGSAEIPGPSTPVKVCN